MAFYGKLRAKADQVKEFLLEHAYLITLGAVVVVIAASAMYTERMKTEFAQEQEAQVEAAAGAPEVGERTEAPLITPSKAPSLTPLPTIAPMRVSMLGTGTGRIWPVSGEVIRSHAPDEPVYWEALMVYQIHPGVDMAGQPGEEIQCVMDGVVERVTRDELWGYSVTVSQTDGTQAKYAGLGFCALMEGQSITRGQVVGEMMEAVPCERELGAHLHLELTRDGMQIDPQLLLQHAKRK